MNFLFLAYIPLFPLLGALINGLLPLSGKRLNRSQSGWLASFMAALSFIFSAGVFYQLLHKAPQARYVHHKLYTWMGAGHFQVDLAFRADALSIIMLLIITGVGTLIHIYSIGYMAHDKDYQRYFSYLNLFLFAMLLLVLGDNLLVMFVGWEGVGLASYLLIGFWFEDTEKAKAGMKAFVVNRIGDLGFLVGIFLIFWNFSTLSFSGIQEQVGVIDSLKGTSFLHLSMLEWACICFFIGAMGKSAQIPLYVWLPDAMAGPTPVSALIHAATMVTAGVYMVARMNFLYTAAPTAALVVASFGALTALFAASIGLFQYDIKKVLAYSTVSQLGFMFIGVGVGAYGAGVFHLMTHAFFKALLFLGAGSVIVGMHHEQDIREMGGLRKYMKITYFTFLVATLAIIGMPGFSGFFSKDEILWKALSGNHPIIWALGTTAAALTAFYMVRLLCLTFFGELRASERVLHHLEGGKPHESPAVMTVPLMILAVLSLAGGWIGIPEILGGANHFEHWLAPIFASKAAHGAGHGHVAHVLGLSIHEWVAMGVAVGVMVVGAGAALAMFLRRPKAALEREAALGRPGEGGLLGAFFRLTQNKYYVDEIYNATIVRPIHQLSRHGLWPFDHLVIDGLVNLSARITKLFASLLSLIQVGNVRFYLYGMAVGLVSLLVWLILTSSSF